MNKVRMVMVTDFSTKFHKFGFWVLIALIAGWFYGSWLTEQKFNERLTDTATYKAIKIDGINYDLKERP